MYLYFHFLVKISHGKDTYLWDRSGGEWVPLSRVNAHPDDEGGGGGFLCQEWMHTLMMMVMMMMMSMTMTMIDNVTV